MEPTVLLLGWFSVLTLSSAVAAALTFLVTIFCNTFLALTLRMSLLLAVTAGDIGFAVRICFPEQTTEVATEWRLALLLTDRINHSNFVFAKIVIGFVVGGKVIFFVNRGDLASFAILMNSFKLDRKLHGLVQRVFVGLHNFATNQFVEAGQKQLMLEELLSIANPFLFALSEIGGSHRNSQAGDVGRNNPVSGDVGWLGLAHFEERIMHPKIVVMHTFALTLSKLGEVGASDLCSVPWLITCQKFILGGIPIVSGNAGVLERIPPKDCSVAEYQVDLGKLASVVPICNTSGCFNSNDKQSCSERVFVLLTKEQRHLR